MGAHEKNEQNSDEREELGSNHQLRGKKERKRKRTVSKKTENEKPRKEWGGTV